MPACDNRSERCVRLLLYLLEHGRITTRSAARLVGATPRRTRADLELLSRFLPLVPSGWGRHRYWLLDPGVGIRHLPVLDRISLLVGKELTAFLQGTALHEGLWRVEGELRDGVPERFGRNLDRKFRYHPEPARSYEACTDRLDAILDALLRERTLRITYQPRGRDTVEYRAIEPLTLVIYRRALYLLARIPGGGVRRFAVDRMQAVQVTGPFAYPEEWDPGSELQGTFGIHQTGEPELVILRFSAEASDYVLARTWHPTQSIHELPDGRVELRMQASGRELVRFVLEWGAQCEAVAPPWLVAGVREELEGALARYRREDTSGPGEPVGDALG